MLTVSQLSKSFAGRALFDDVSLQVNRGDRIGLVGPNGAGKSTLFALLLGDVSPDKGTIAIEKNATIGFLPQETAAAGDETVLELALAVSPELVQAQKVIKAHEAGHGHELSTSMRQMTRLITMRSMFLMSTAGGSSNQKQNGSSPDSLFAKLISIARRAP